MIRVDSKLQIQHFIKYLKYKGVRGEISIIDKHHEYYVVDINNEECMVHEDAVPLIQTRCQNIVIVNRMVQ